MANHKSAIKRYRQSLKRRDRNREVKEELKNAIKKARVAAEKGNSAEAKKLALEAEIKLAKASVKGIIHPANAKRRISRITSLSAKSKK
jgi:small subunit ribosomal protein S20